MPGTAGSHGTTALVPCTTNSSLFSTFPFQFIAQKMSNENQLPHFISVVSEANLSYEQLEGCFNCTDAELEELNLIDGMASYGVIMSMANLREAKFFPKQMVGSTTISADHKAVHNDDQIELDNILKTTMEENVVLKQQNADLVAHLAHATEKVNGHIKLIKELLEKHVENMVYVKEAKTEIDELKQHLQIARSIAAVSSSSSPPSLLIKETSTCPDEVVNKQLNDKVLLFFT